MWSCRCRRTEAHDTSERKKPRKLTNTNINNIMLHTTQNKTQETFNPVNIVRIAVLCKNKIVTVYVAPRVGCEMNTSCRLRNEYFKKVLGSGSIHRNVVVQKT